MSRTVFVADLHLSEESVALNRLFERCLDTWQGQIDALYVLGDFFDAWVGDDDDSEFIRRIKTRLAEFTRHTPVYFLHGNRDFLLGAQFAQETGIRLLPETVAVELYGRRYVLAHGDSLCTDDTAYQAFRLQSHNPLWQQAVLAKPLAERRLLAGQIRHISEQRKTAEGKSEMSDATEDGVQALMQHHAADPMPTLIHGHTHRPAVHEHICQTNGLPFARHVLQDWYGEAGGYVSVDADGVHSHPLAL
ncbi:UDP-2,3-diacylglucosamine hydrolase [Neisseria sp. HSC-16F19]|nr:UDP-2,3-diacylglucosamine diphosphatase [Neisseria sp. HSC-16F19]MCP2041701.1 UDP-2,3-diacylglucosamine hydrolase [Neisseria sp. HSC-16F19]